MCVGARLSFSQGEVAVKRIIVVGGGAGGLELVTKLGKKLGRKGKAHITLVDRDTTHLWKPLLHEIAVGAMDEGVDAVSFRAHAYGNHFYFRVGSLIDIDREAKQIVLAPMRSEEHTSELQSRGHL